jgi:hypothetical protein
MWPFKNRRNLARPEEFPGVIDALRDKLRSNGFGAEADQLHYLVHEGVWTTSNELYGELFAALKIIHRECRNLPGEIDAEIRRLMKSINSICRWR